MSKAGKILVIGGASALGIYTLVHLVSTSATADAIDYHIENFNLKSQSISGYSGIGLTIPKVVFKTDIKADNPTTQDLLVEQPYLKVYYNNKLIGSSNATSKTVTIKAKDSTYLHDVDVVFYATDVVPVMPDFIRYILSRFGGAKPTRKLKVDIITSGNGINKTITKEVAL